MFNLSGIGDPTNSYTTAGIALRIMWPRKPTTVLEKVHVRGAEVMQLRLSCACIADEVHTIVMQLQAWRLLNNLRY
jgi:hypothetical protein